MKVIKTPKLSVTLNGKNLYLVEGDQGLGVRVGSRGKAKSVAEIAQQLVKSDRRRFRKELDSLGQHRLSVASLQPVG